MLAQQKKINDKKKLRSTLFSIVQRNYYNNYNLSRFIPSIRLKILIKMKQNTPEKDNKHLKNAQILQKLQELDFFGNFEICIQIDKNRRNVTIKRHCIYNCSRKIIKHTPKDNETPAQVAASVNVVPKHVLSATRVIEVTYRSYYNSGI